MHTLSGNHTESKHPLFEEHISVCTGLPPRGENARSGGGKPISLERRKAGQLHMRLHSWRQASEQSSLPLALRSSVLSVLSFASFPPLGGPLRASTSCAMVRFADCRDRRREWILRHSPGDRPGCRTLSEMTGERAQSVGMTRNLTGVLHPTPAPIHRCALAGALADVSIDAGDIRP